MKRICLFLLLCSCISSLSPGEESEAWTEQTVYATANGENTDICAIYEIKVLMSPQKQVYIADTNDTYTLQWEGGDMKAEKMKLPYPENVKKIITFLQEKKDDKPARAIQNPGYHSYREKLLDYGFSIGTFRRFVFFIFPEFGRVFIVPPFEKAPSFFHVKHTYKELEIISCALEARNGQIPVFFIGRNDGINSSRSPKLGLVSLKTRGLREIGQWRQVPYEAIDGSLGWLDDDRLFLLRITRGASFWGVFNIKTEKMDAQGESHLAIKGVDAGNEIIDYLIKDGRLYGYFDDERVRFLYSEKKQVPHTDEEPGSTF